MIDCPTCNQPNPAGASFCIYCGGNLPGSEGPMEPPTAKVHPSAAAPGTLPGRPASGVFVQPGAPRTDLAPSSPGILAPGTVVDGKYSILSILGEGGMGVVYLATDIHTQVRVVVKAIRSEYTHRQEFRDRILAEGRALAAIDHNNVVRLNAVVVEPDAMYLVMQFVEGESLDKTIERYVAQRTPMPLDLVLRIFHQVLDGVGAAHDAGVIHRDLKPANILIRQRDAVAKVTDFGIAKAEEDAQAGRGQTKGIIGSLLYMAPEQIQGRRDLDKRVDIYGLGIVLYELLVGRVPFDAPSEFEIMKLHLEGELPMISQMRRDIPPYIDSFIRRACAKDREHRFSSTQQMSSALRQGQASTAVVSFGATPTAAGKPAPHALVAPGPVRSEPPASVMRGELARAGFSARPSARPSSMLGMMVGVLAVAVAAVATGVGGAWYFGWLDPEPSKAPPMPTMPTMPTLPTFQPPIVEAAAAPDVVAEPPAHKRPLQALEGGWVSDSGRVYDASMSGDKLQFRIRDATGLEKDGYVSGEPRFTLSGIPGEIETFSVEDKIRPALPAGMVYDLSRARSTCQEVWTSVGGEPLRARFDGTRLTVEGAKIEPSRSSFLQEGGRVVGCVGLSAAKAARLEGIFRRN